MRSRTFGLTGRAVPVIGQGTWHLDGGDPALAVATLRAGLDAGMSHIDTAEMYGEAEPLVGRPSRGAATRCSSSRRWCRAMPAGRA